MRLTLRTLLAYLDNTLDPQDAEILQAKLGESGFATQLVQRIRASLVNSTLSAPEPGAVAPVEDANVICEYLDSTLSAEQVAEIERACLESETHLAEAAACHQILTMVLGQPAEVSPQLRRRVYELPDRELKEIPTGGSFSSLSIPTEQDSTPLGSEFGSELPTVDAPLTDVDDTPTLDQPATAAEQPVTAAGHPGTPVTPVGPGDSGVSDAPTRLRESGTIADPNHPAIAGDRPNDAIRRSDMYGGSIRPSRITPWLVSLALAGVLLFALAQIFSPLLTSRTAKSDGDSIRENEILVEPENAPPMMTVETDPENSENVTTIESLPAPGNGATTQGDDATSVDSNQITTDPSASGETSSSAAENALAGDSIKETTRDETPNVTMDSAGPDGIGGPNDPVLRPLGDRSEPDSSSAKIASGASTETVMDSESLAPPREDTEMTEADVESEEDVAVKGKAAKILSDSTLLVGRVQGGDWVRMTQDTVVGPGVSIACAPLFQGHMTSAAGLDVILVGATNVAWEQGDAELATTLSVENGRVLIGSLDPDVTVGLRLGESVVGLHFADPEAVIAVTRSQFRAPGFDPLKSDNHLPTSTVLAVQGTVKLTLDGNATTLSTGEQWTLRGVTPAAVEPTEAPPAWIEDPDADQDEVYTLARDTLLELIEGDQPITDALREATMFRRSEVAALAGRSLLNMGVGDVYFGGDGLLSQVNQRNYWPDHYRALVESINRSDQSASDLFDSVRAMESADADTIIRLLAGYSQKQLVEGSDEILVGLLDSNSMAVRVLARETLRAITGISLNFKAEQNNAVRRAPEIKKWGVRLRKGDIRWQPAS